VFRSPFPSRYINFAQRRVWVLRFFIKKNCMVHFCFGTVFPFCSLLSSPTRILSFFNTQKPLDGLSKSTTPAYTDLFIHVALGLFEFRFNKVYGCGQFLWVLKIGALPCFYLPVIVGILAPPSGNPEMYLSPTRASVRHFLSFPVQAE